MLRKYLREVNLKVVPLPADAAVVVGPPPPPRIKPDGVRELIPRGFGAADIAAAQQWQRKPDREQFITPRTEALLAGAGAGAGGGTPATSPGDVHPMQALGSGMRSPGRPSRLPALSSSALQAHPASNLVIVNADSGVVVRPFGGTVP